jgi:hypothetical protein
MEGVTLLQSALKNPALNSQTLCSVLQALIGFGAGTFILKFCLNSFWFSFLTNLFGSPSSLVLDVSIPPQDQKTTSLHLAIQTNDINVIQIIGDAYATKMTPSQLKDFIYKQKDSITGMPPAKYAGKSKSLAKDAEKYFKLLCKK